MAPPHFGRFSSTELCGQPSLSTLYSKLQFISLREFSSISPAKDDDDDAQPVAAAQPVLPEEWPDFSKMKRAPQVRKRFFNRNKEYDIVMDHVNDEPSQPLLLLGPVNSGKSVSHAIVS